MKIRKTFTPAAAPFGLFSGVASIADDKAGERIEKEIGERFAPFFFSLCCGKAVLQLLLSALKSINPRRKVVIPGYTCFSVPAAVRKAGLTIAPCDIRSDTLDFDFDHLEEITDDDTLCIISTHLFGIRSDIGRAKKIADSKGAFLVEDSAQAFPTSEGAKEGARGDAEFFSFGRGKNITCGSGGLLTTTSKKIADAVRNQFESLETEPWISPVCSLAGLAAMKVFMQPWLYWFPDGLPFLGLGETVYDENFPLLKMNKRKYGLISHWEEMSRSADETRSFFGEKFKESLGVDRKQHIYSRRFPYLRFPVYVKDARAKSQIMEESRHLGVSGMYPSSICAVRELSGFVKAGSCPGADDIAARLVTLPTHHLITGEIIEKICSKVAEKICLSQPEMSNRIGTKTVVGGDV